MNIRFLQTINLDMENRRLRQTWDKSYARWDKTFNRWEELKVEAIYLSGNKATLKTYNDEFILNVPIESFEKLPEGNTTSLL